MTDQGAAELLFALQKHTTETLTRLSPELQAQTAEREAYWMQTIITILNALKRGTITIEQVVAVLPKYIALQNVEKLFDNLTQIWNQRGIRELGEKAIAHAVRDKQPLVFALLDFDDLKSINDQYGHSTGDDVLRSFTEIIGSQMKRGSDILGRIGGDEFVLILPLTEKLGAGNLLEQIRQSIENKLVQSVSWPEGKSPAILTMSIGFTELGVGETFDRLYARADQAAYAAKQLGKNKVVAWNPRLPPIDNIPKK